MHKQYQTWFILSRLLCFDNLFENVYKINLIIGCILENKPSFYNRLTQFDISYDMISEKSLEWCIELLKSFWQVQSRNHDMIKNDSDMEENFLTV